MPARPSRGGCKTAVALVGARVARVTATKGGAWRGAAGRAHGEVRGGRETCRRRKNKKKFPAWGVRELRETETLAVFFDSGRRNLMRVSNCMLASGTTTETAVDGGCLSSCSQTEINVR